MMTLSILTFILVSIPVFVVVEASNGRPKAQCRHSKDSKGLLTADCSKNHLEVIPEILLPDVQVFNLEDNYIGTLTNDSFLIYPNIKKLYLSFNKVHTIESDSLRSLNELETLDLSHNAVKEVPAGLPKSLHKLYLSGNPVKNMQHLGEAVGLQSLQLRGCDLDGYPALGLLPNLIDLDVSDNARINSLNPVQLAGTCRLAKLNVTANDQLFAAGRPGSHCQCRRVVEWARTYKITLHGMRPCPDAVDADGSDDPKSENCTRTPDAALEVFKACMAEWEHRNMPYWAICSGLVIAAAVLVTLCACLRRRRKRGRGNGKALQSVPSSDTKDNNESAAAAVDNKTEPGALLSSSS